MANIIESRVTLEDEVFEETIDTMEEPIEVVRPSSYNDLEDLPQVNGVTLIGNKTSEELGIVTATDIENAVSAEATLRENADTALGGRIDGEITNRTNADNALGTRIDNEILARQGGDNNLQTQIDAITSKSDVVDVVADYAALQAYDTQHLGNNDVIKVLDDETQDDAQTYYRWNKTAGTWSYIGSEAPYYSKGQMDTMLQAKQDKLIAGTNIQIAQDGKTISATDTTYTAGNGLNLNGTEFSADTTVLATKSDLDNYYTKTETDTKLAPKLEAEVVAELPSTGTEGKLYLTPKNYTTGTATGNPVTITLGEEAGQITDAKLDGDTYQQSYTGKNLFRNLDQDTSFRGVEYTVNPDGTVNIHGKATGGEASFSQSVPLVESLIENGATYTWWATKTIPDGLEIRVGSYNGSTWVAHVFAPGDRILSSALQSLTKAANIQSDVTRLVFQYCVLNGKTVDIDGIGAMLEAGSTATTYEPYVGGTASPNPDYPQQIQTVTGTQTVEVTGKNLFNKDNFVGGNYYVASAGTITEQANYRSIVVPCLPSTTYTVSKQGQSPLRVAYCNSTSVQAGDTAYGYQRDTTANSQALTITTGEQAKTLVVTYKEQGHTIGTDITSLMIELGSTATTYTPYNKQTLPINLGSIELCKLSTYQDYIYKDGDDWKVHKATAFYQITGQESDLQINTSQTNTARFFSNTALSATGAAPGGNSALILCNRLERDSTIWSTDVVGIYVNQAAIVGRMNKTVIGTTVESARSYFANNPTLICYQLATPTDTTITDQTLIAQLEAVRTASLQASNTITNTATGSNLAGDMELGYYEYDPTNRYDKWLWLDLNSNYEKLGS